MAQGLDSLRADWDLIGEDPLALAVSGGADSFALLHACAARGLPVVALTVDHGLREGSAEDAGVVAAWCEARGILHETLRWEGEKPRAGIQDAARTARYRLLCEACERLGLDRLATGHTLDDQAETVFMRLRRGAGRGLAGMPPSRKIASGPGEPVTLLRPMLGVRRAEARAYAEAHALPVRVDPSNEDEGFERVRVRALLGALEEQELLTAEALARTASSMTSLLWTAAVNAFGLIRSNSHWVHDGAFHSADRQEFEGLQGSYLLDAIVEAIGDAKPQFAVNAIYGLPLVRAGCVVSDYAGGGAVIYREPAALIGRADGTPGVAPVPTRPSTRHLYDRRFVVHVPEGIPPGTELRPLGQLFPRDIVTATLARARVSTLPCLARDGVVTHLPAAARSAVREAWGGWKRAGEVMPNLHDDTAVFDARSLLAERFANEVIRY